MMNVRADARGVRNLIWRFSGDSVGHWVAQ